MEIINNYAAQPLPSKRSTVVYILLCLVTIGFYGLYIIYKFAQETNIACEGDGKHTRGLLGFIFLSIITLGIYEIVWYVNWLNRTNAALHYKYGEKEGLSIGLYILTLFLLGPLTLGIMYLYIVHKVICQQNRINDAYNRAHARFGTIVDNAK